MTDVFISYSRKDIAFARLLYQSLGQCDLDTWIDWERIPIGEKWWGEICQAIEKSHVFMFIISRNSVGSNVCRDEINEALRHNKRIIPIVVDNLGPEVVGNFFPDLNKINWILFERDHIFRLVENPDGQGREPEDGQGALPKDPQFKEALGKLVSAIHTDWEWVRYHTQLQVDALRWETNQRNASYLIRGAALEEAEGTLLRAGGKDPRPTGLQAEYITASRQEETRRQQAQLQLEQKARQRQRLALWAVGIGLGVALGLGVFAWSQRNEAVNQSNTRATAEAIAVSEANTRATAEVNAVNEAHIRATAQTVAEEQRDVAFSKQIAIQANSLLDTHLDLALLLSIRSTGISPDIEGQSSLLQAVLRVPFLQKILMTGEQDNNYGVAYNVDGSQIAAGHMNEVWLFDAQTGALVERLGGSVSAQIGELAYEPSGERLAAGRSDGTIELWDTQQGPEQQPRVLDGDQGAITALAYSADSRMLASSSREDLILWDVANGKPLFRFPDADNPVELAEISSLVFSPDGSLLAVGDVASYVYLLDVKNGEQTTEPLNSRTFWGKSADSANWWVSSLAFHPDGKRLAVAAGLGVAVIDLDSRQALNGEPVTYQANCAKRGVAFTQDGKYMVSAGCGDLLVDLADTYQTVFSVSTPLLSVNSLAISPDGQSFVTSGLNGSVFLWAQGDRPWLAQERVTQHLTEDSLNFTALDYFPSADLFAANICPLGPCVVDGKNLNEMAVWQGENYPERAALEDPGAVIFDLAISPDGNILAGLSDSTPVIYLWDIASREIQSRLTVQGDFTPSSIAFDPRGDRLFAAGCAQPDPVNCEAGAVQVWNTATGEPDGNLLLADQGNINRIAFRPDGGQFATVGSEDVLLLWDTQEMRVVEEVPIPTTYTTGAYSVVFSPDGQRLAIGTGKGNVLLWDISAEPSLSATFTGPEGFTFYTLAFSPDGQTLVGGNMGGSVYLWDLAQTRQFGPEILNNYEGDVSSTYLSKIVFGETPSEIWVAGQVGLSKWDLDETLLESHACRLANRNFTAAEWLQYFPDEPYQLVCPEQNQY